MATFLLSIFGPVKYINGVYKYWLVFPFMIGVCFCLCIGYYLGKNTKSKICKHNSEQYITYKENQLLTRSLIISIASLLLEFIYLIVIGHFSFSLFDLGILYISRIENNANIVTAIRFLCFPFRMIANVVGIYKYKNVSRHVKKLIAINISLYIMVFLFGYGNQKGTSDIVIYILVAIYVTNIRRNKTNDRQMKWMVIAILTMTLFLFSYMQYSRYAPRGINATNYHLYSTGEFYYDTNHIILKIFGDKLGFGMASIMSGYLSQGYYGLSLCMQLPFEWSWGIGSSYAICKLLSKFGVSGIYERTYLSRMTESFGRDGLRSWNTIFPWLASDYTWVGTMLFFVLVGYFCAKAWKEVIKNDNIISYLMLVDILILVLFTPANNQLFHGYDSFISTWFIVIFWIFFRGKYMHDYENSKD